MGFWRILRSTHMFICWRARKRGAGIKAQASCPNKGQFRKRSTRKRRPKHKAPKSRKRSTQTSKTKHPKLENEDPQIESEAPQIENEDPKISKTKHPKLENEALKTRKRRPLNLENKAPKTRNHCRFNQWNFTSYMTQSESGRGSGCVRTSKGPQNPSQGFITNCFTERF